MKKTRCHPTKGDTVFCLVGDYAISENFIIANRVLIDAAAIAGVALDGVDNAVFDLLDDTDMIGLTVLRARAALIIPVEEDDHAGRGLHGVIRPLPTLPKPLDTIDAACELWNDTSVDMKIILDVLETTGITATAGIGTNLFLCKVAMDIVAKHIPADKNGVRIAELDEMKFRQELWSHQPLTDFWRVGHGYAKKLEQNGMFTMGDVARCSVHDEDKLYKLFGKNAELLIDHAWGWEPTTIEAIKAYRPSTNSLGSGQVLHQPYTAEKAKLVLREMADLLVLDLVDKGLVTDQIVVTVGYDIENLTDPERSKKYHGAIVKDHYGRQIPKHAHGTANLDGHTSSTKKIMCAASELFDRIVDKNLLVRRLNIVANHVLPEADAPKKNDGFEQLDFFTDYAALEAKQERERAELERERKMQQAMLTIKKKFGKNAILKGMNLEEGATAKDRNAQIGGHKA